MEFNVERKEMDNGDLKVIFDGEINIREILEIRDYLNNSEVSFINCCEYPFSEPFSKYLLSFYIIFKTYEILNKGK